MASNSTIPSDDGDYKIVYEEEDDEQTIEEEEQLSVADGQRELDDLQADANMPLDELLKMYSNTVPSSASNNNNQSDEDDDDESTNSSVNDNDEEEEEEEEHHHHHHHHTLHHLFHSVHERLLPHNGEDDDDDTEDSLFEPDIVKIINVGDEYQAHVEDQIEFDPSNGLCDERDVAIDELLWSPSSTSDLDEEHIDDYLKTIHIEYPSSDEEISLQTLLDCQMKPDLALVKFRQLPVKTIYSYSSWSLVDSELLEQGLREYGKNFSKIAMFKFSNRTVRELIHFYYQWKKSERHQLFLEEQQRLNSITSSVSDIIEKFLEEQEHQLCAAAGVADSSSSSSSLLAPDLKRHSALPSNASISLVTIHQQETITKRSFDQIDDEQNGSGSGLSTKKTARFCETNTTTTTTTKTSSSTETIV